MVKLSREIVIYLASEYGTQEVLRRLSDPFWFQAFGCVLGFDWHSSGVTTTSTGALKEGLRGIEHELGVYSLGGKGATSRKTPDEIRDRCERLAIDPGPLMYASRMSAKVDSAAVQDGYQLYHHAFFFSGAGRWCVVQQGMSGQSRTARRYHWLSESVTSFVNELHEAICSDRRAPTLNLVAAEHEEIRAASVELASASPDRVMNIVWRHIPSGAAPSLPFGDTPTLDMPARHALQLQDFNPRHLRSVLLSTYERAPRDFETLLGLEGVGGRTLRALALVSEVIYGTPASTRDPARFAFAHGGKDGTPFPVDRAAYDRTIDTLHRAMTHARVDRSEKVDALKRLSRFARSTEPVHSKGGPEDPPLR
jgi:hypothetical protein